jgi:hypothetical protein
VAVWAVIVHFRSEHVPMGRPEMLEEAQVPAKAAAAAAEFDPEVDVPPGALATLPGPVGVF